MSEKPALGARKAPKQLRSRRKVERLLAATAHILADEGWSKLTTNRVAEEADLSIGTLYQYFPNKQALVAELIERHVAQELERLDAELTALQGEPLEMVIERLVRTYIEIHWADLELTRALHVQVARLDLAEPLRRATKTFEKKLAHLYRERSQEIKPRDAELAAHLSVNAVESLTVLTLLEQPEQLAEAFFEELIEMVQRYLLG